MYPVYIDIRGLSFSSIVILQGKVKREREREREKEREPKTKRVILFFFFFFCPGPEREHFVTQPNTAHCLCLGSVGHCFMTPTSQGVRVCVVILSCSVFLPSIFSKFSALEKGNVKGWGVFFCNARRWEGYILFYLVFGIAL